MLLVNKSSIMLIILL